MTMESTLQSFGLRPLDVDSDLAHGARALFQHVDIDLASARAFGDNFIPIAGDFLTIDFDVSMGQGIVPFTDSPLRIALANRAGQLGTPLPMWHGSVIRAPFYGLSLAHAAGQGTIRLLYGFGVSMDHQARYTSIVRGVTGAPTVLNSGTDPAGMTVFFSNAGLAAGTVLPIVSAASNTQGIFLQDFVLNEFGGGCGLVYGTTAPTTQYSNPSLGSTTNGTPPARPVSLPPGHRLDVIGSLALSAANWSITALYKLTRP